MSQGGDPYRQVLNDIKQLSFSPNPIVYVYSVIYVDDPLVTTGDYVNNANVDAVNEEILKMCREEGYHYINLNEVLSNGSHGLISGSAEDGIHLNAEYCKDWLNYTKTHYTRCLRKGESMKNKKKALILTVLCAFAALLLTACGGKSWKF
ncbi:MAG: GDSL-type esterase/lipase family protein [Lachnospiraceae bacterium]